LIDRTPDNLPRLRIIPLGGLGEIGKNMLAVEYDGDVLIIDAGLMFPNADMFGIDYVIPDFGYLRAHPELIIRAIVITHGHEDHIGAIAHVVEAFAAPVYATPFTCALIDSKLRGGRLRERAQLTPFNPGDKLTIGPFTVEPFHMCHSIPDSVGLAIQTPVGLIVHSGDYKFDQTPVDGWPPDYALIGSFATRGTLLLMSDSTNADRHGWTPSERVIDAAFGQIFRDAPGRIFVATFASLISRVQQVADAAVQHGRKLAIAGHSMTDNVRLAIQLGHLTFEPGLQISIDEALKMPPAEVVFMITGAQGEPDAVLNRLASGKHNLLQIEAGDTVVLSSHPIPGNEEAVNLTINRLFQRGAHVIYDALTAVHVSGHASQDEQKMLLNLVRPHYFIPVHGEPRHLRHHAQLAEQVGIPRGRIAVIENGQVVEFDHARNMTLAERFPGGYIFVDGSSVGEVAFDIVHEREKLARRGFIAVSLSVSRETRLAVGEVQIASRGVVRAGESTDTLFARLRDAAGKSIESSANETSEKRDAALHLALSHLIRAELHRRPLIFVLINEV
jgi:ribonuclease J